MAFFLQNQHSRTPSASNRMCPLGLVPLLLFTLGMGTSILSPVTEETGHLDCPGYLSGTGECLALPKPSFPLLPVPASNTSSRLQRHLAPAKPPASGLILGLVGSAAILLSLPAALLTPLLPLAPPWHTCDPGLVRSLSGTSHVHWLERWGPFRLVAGFWAGGRLLGKDRGAGLTDKMFVIGHFCLSWTASY